MAFWIIRSGFSYAEVNIDVDDKVPKLENSANSLDKDDVIISKQVSDFEEVFKDQKLQPMDTETMAIKLKEHYELKAWTVPSKVPYVKRDEELKQIRKLVVDGIIAAV